MEQGTTEWRDARLGMFTGSCASYLVTEPRNKKDRDDGVLSETLKGYILENICEELTGIDDNFNSEATDHGTLSEPEAVSDYEIDQGVKVDRVGFIPFNENAGCSPDGLVGDDGMIEIKCPFKPKNHLSYYLMNTPEDFKKQCKAYYWQVQFNLMCTGREWCDFVSWSEAFTGKLKMKILRIPINQDDVILLHEKLSAAIAYKELMLIDLQ